MTGGATGGVTGCGACSTVLAGGDETGAVGVVAEVEVEGSSVRVGSSGARAVPVLTG